jgi:hypothetical protein
MMTPRASRRGFVAGVDGDRGSKGSVEDLYMDGYSPEEVEDWATPKEESGFVLTGRGEANMF